MMREEEIKNSLLKKFPFLEEKIAIPRERRIFAGPMAKDDFEKAFEYIVKELNFNDFHMIVGLDSGDNLEFVYILTNPDQIVLNVKLLAPKSNPVIETITDIFPNALWHERELEDLLGAKVNGLPEGPHYPLPDGWPEGNYPLRKDWHPEYFDKETMTYNPPAPKENNDEEQIEKSDSK